MPSLIECHPNPIFCRQEWFSLNGNWEFAFDDSGQGLEQGWYEAPRLPLNIEVPYPYQSERSGIGDKSVHNLVWYALNFEVPEDWLSGDLLIHFGAVDYNSSLWVNGEEVGHNRGGHVPFSFDIRPYVNEGTNRLVLRVEDTLDPHQPRGKQSKTGEPYTVYYPCTSGIWQSVWLEPVPQLRIDSLKTMPELHEGGFSFDLTLHAPWSSYGLEVEVLDRGNTVNLAEFPFDGAAIQGFVPIPGLRPWSPDEPSIYELAVRLRQHGEVVDTVHSYVGIRSVALRDGGFHLNGQPLYLKMVLDQGYWPDTLLCAPSDQALKEDVEWAKRLGFNGIRKHQKVEDPRWLYWCDRLGLLVFAEMPSAKAWSFEAEQMFEEEWRRSIERDRNHPCIAAWVPFNESWGVPDLAKGHPKQHAFIERVVQLTRQLDPGRPIIGNDGWEHPDISDICSIHDYSPNGKELALNYEQVKAGEGLPQFAWRKTAPIFTNGGCHSGQPVMLTEVGGFLYRPDGVTLEELDASFPGYGAIDSYEELAERYRELIETIGSLPFVCGFCYTQLTDVEQEENGLLTYDRRPKVDPAAIRAINEALGEQTPCSHAVASVEEGQVPAAQ